MGAVGADGVGALVRTPKTWSFRRVTVSVTRPGRTALTRWNQVFHSVFCLFCSLRNFVCSSRSETNVASRRSIRARNCRISVSLVVNISRAMLVTSSLLPRSMSRSSVMFSCSRRALVIEIMCTLALLIVASSILPPWSSINWNAIVGRYD